jgi:prophage maintenance system killer protein
METKEQHLKLRTFLRANGYKITELEPNEAVNALSKVSSGQATLDNLVSRLRRYLRPA